MHLDGLLKHPLGLGGGRAFGCHIEIEAQGGEASGLFYEDAGKSESGACHLGQYNRRKVEMQRREYRQTISSPAIATSTVEAAIATKRYQNM